MGVSLCRDSHDRGFPKSESPPFKTTNLRIRYLFFINLCYLGMNIKDSIRRISPPQQPPAPAQYTRH